jgi:hypothetical protein
MQQDTNSKCEKGERKLWQPCRKVSWSFKLICKALAWVLLHCYILTLDGSEMKFYPKDSECTLLFSADSAMRLNQRAQCSALIKFRLIFIACDLNH